MGICAGRRCWGSFLCLALLSCVAWQPVAAQESGRWRYGTISWTRIGDPMTSTRVQINVESAWRLSHPAIVVLGTQDRVSERGQQFKVSATDTEDPILLYGDGEMTAKFDVTVDRVEPLEDMVVGTSVYDHTFPSMGTFNVSLTLCCRVSGTWNAMRSVKLETMINLEPGVMESPKFNMMPTISLDSTAAAIRGFRVPAVSSEGRPLTFSMGTDSQYGYRSKAAPTEVVLGIDSATGVVSIDTTCHFNSGNCTITLLGRPATVYDPQLVVQVSDGKSFVTVDFYVIMQYPGSSAIPLLTLIGPDAPSPLNGLETTSVGEMPTIEAFAGFNVQMRVRASDPDPGEAVFFQYSTLPGFSTKSEVNGANPAGQEINWIPQPYQQGKSVICIAALDKNPSTSCTPCPDGATACIPICPAYRRSQPLCFVISVVDNPAPVFIQPTVTTMDTYMNQEMRMMVQATSGSNWADQVTLTVANVHPEGSSIIPVPGYMDRAEFVWTPGRQFGGYSQDVCFRAQGTAGPARTVKNTTLCVRMTVVKCMWNVGAGETLDSIAALFGSNYVQMWALNVEKDSPDADLAPGDKVRIGHMYQVRSTDNLRYLTVQFATTRDTIVTLNNGMLADSLGDKDALADVAGMNMCILPHSCVGYNQVEQA